MANQDAVDSSKQLKAFSEVNGNKELKDNSCEVNAKCSQTKQLPLVRDTQMASSASKDIAIACDHDKVLSKYKGRKNRELNDLEENQILNARLRSNSGKVYSSSVSVEASQAPPQSSACNLDTVEEEESSEDIQVDIENMCGKEECCKGTSTLITMISKLQKSVDGVLKKVSTQEILTSNTSHRIQEVEEKCDSNAEEIDDLGKELQDTKFQLDMVTKIVIKQDQQISFLKQKIVDIQQREMSSNVIIAGIPESKNEKPLILFNTFVQKSLELQELIPANRAYRIGSGNNRPLLVEVRNVDFKQRLFANATKLKGKVNENGKPYFISDHLPEEKNEERKRINELYSENKKKPTSHKLEMNISRGRLIINEEKYEKAVQAPAAKDLLKPDERLFDLAGELDIVKGGSDIKSESKFTAYAVAVENFDNIRAALLKMRMKFADATHVSCAFRLPGANTPINQDYIDDGEFGCGRTMLKVLRDQQYMNMAVFMVRYYGGTHLGVSRYDIFRQLAQSAIRALMNKRKTEEGEAVSTLPQQYKIENNFPTEPAPLEDWNNDEGDWSNQKKSD